MQLDTTRFGTLDIEENDVITFTQPILGFQEFRRFVLREGPPGSNLKWLQSIDAGDLAFILMNPESVVPDYTVELRPHDLNELAAEKPEQLDMYTIVVVPEDRTQIRTNLRAPIIINVKHRLGKQLILDRSQYPIRYYLAQKNSEDGGAEEVSHARSDA